MAKPNLIKDLQDKLYSRTTKEKRVETFAALKTRVLQDADRYHAAFDTLKRDRDEGMTVPENALEEAEQKATVYGNLQSVFAAETADARASVTAAIASAQRLLETAQNPLARATAEDLLNELRFLQ